MRDCTGFSGTLPIANGGTAAPNAAGAFTNIVAQGGNLTGAINEARGTVAMHATTMDIWTGKPAILDGTGSAVTITAIANAPQAGARRTLYPIAGTVITNGATFAVDGGANYTTVSGDALEFEAITTSTYKVHITKKDGTAVVVPAATPFASSAENIAGTVENKAVDPLGIREAFNATGSAPVYACRAWVNFNGTGTVAIRAAGNVGSMTDNGVGDYTANITTAMPDVDYITLPSLDYGSYAPVMMVRTQLTTSVRVFNYADTAGSTDRALLALAIIR